MKMMNQFVALRDEAGDGDGAGGGDFVSHTGLYTAEGVNQERIDALPEDATALRSLTGKYKTEGDFLNGLNHLNKLAGQKRLERPAEGASEDDVRHFNEQMRQINGTPENIADYGAARPEDVPEDAWSQDLADKSLAILHKHNASPELVKELFDAQGEFIKGNLAEMSGLEEQLKAADILKIKEQFGADTDKVLADGARAAATLGIDVPDGGILDLQLDRVSVATMMNNLTKIISEDRLVSPRNDGGDRGADTVQSLTAELAAMKGDSTNQTYQDFNSGNASRRERAIGAMERVRNKITALQKGN